MAPIPKHTINKYQFDVVLQNEKDYPVISQTLTQIFYQELQGEIEKIFSNQNIPAELVITIDKIEIDLGDISRNNLEKELKEKFIRELSQSIKKAIVFNQGNSKTSVHISTKELELLRYYLRRGTLPWWSSILMKSLDSTFRKLILSQTSAVREMVFEEAIYPTPRSRIINQFRDPTIYALFGIISAQPADYYKYYTDNLIAINQHSKIANERDVKYKKVIQDLTFIYLLDQQGTSINQQEFFKSQIKALAIKYDLDYFTLVKRVFISSQEILGVKESISSPIVKLSRKLYEEEILIDRTRVNPEEKFKVSQKILEELLKRGSSSIPFQKIGFSSKDEIFQWLAETAPKAFVLRYQTLGKEWAVRERTITLFDETSLAVLFEKAAPKKKQLVFEVFEILETIQQEITPINQETIAFKKVIRHFALELLVFQDLNTMTNESYFQQQIQLFSKKYNISEFKILQILMETIDQLKGHKRGYQIIKKVIEQSKVQLINQVQPDEIGLIPSTEIANIFLQLKENYSTEILNRLERQLVRYLNIYSYGLKDLSTIYFFIVKQLAKLSGDNPIEILEQRINRIDTKTKEELKNKILSEQAIERTGIDFVRIEYLIDRLKDTPLKEWILALGKKDAKEILIDLIFEKGSDLAEFVEQQKYDIHLSKILAAQLELIEFRFLIKQFRLSEANKILEVFENILIIQERWKVARTSKNQFEIFLKEQIIRYIQSGKKEEIELFVFDKMKHRGLINFKNLTLFRDYIDFSGEFWSVQSVADLLLGISVLGREPIKSIQNIFLQDLVLHYLAHGSVPTWIEKDLYEKVSIRQLFKARIKEANVTFAQKLSQLLASQTNHSRIFELIGNGKELEFFKWFEKIPGHYNITPIIEEIQQFFQMGNLKQRDKKLFEAIIQYKIWLVPDKKTRVSILQHFLLAEGFKMDSKQILRDEWLFIYEFIFGRILVNTNLEAYRRKVVEKIQKHPLRFYEALKKIPNPEKQLVKIFNQIPRDILVQWFLNVLNRGPFPEGIKKYGALTIGYFTSNLQNKYLEGYMSIFLIHLLRPGLIQGHRIRRFFEELQNLSKKTSAEILGIFLNSTPSEKRSLWHLYPEQFSMGNTYRLPGHLKQEWVLVLHYMQYGSIPFFGNVPLGIEEIRLKLLRLIVEAPSFMRVHLYRLLRADVARKNFASLLQPIDVPIILKVIHPDLNRDWDQISVLINKSSLEQSLRSSLGWLSWKEELEAMLKIWVNRNFFISGTAEIIVPIIKKYAKRERIEPNLMVGLIGAKDEIREIKIVKEISSLLKLELREEKGVSQERANEGEVEEAEKSGIFINNAGLVLLWPFLGRYFKRLNMIKDGDFISEELRMRGIQLTQYLVTGKTEIEESELALNRLLCGAKTDMVIEYDLDITEEEIALSESLLQGAIYNWEKMRGTRIDTFRQTFLQRDGVLRKGEDYYELRVEEKSYDMLLTTLPWNLGMIKLAWMKSRLTVIWK